MVVVCVGGFCDVVCMMGFSVLGLSEVVCWLEVWFGVWLLYCMMCSVVFIEVGECLFVCFGFVLIEVVVVFDGIDEFCG